jgi:hypothetical protein
LLESTVQFDPYFILAWQVYGWHLAYNLNAESVTMIDKRYWLNEGINVLQRAVAMNPGSWEMHFELGWTYFDRSHDPWRAADIFHETATMPKAPSYISRMYYHCYEHVMDFEHLWPAMEFARSKYPDDHPHQVLVNRSIAWWKARWNNPEEHRRQIVAENSSRQQRALPFYLYPNDPFWNVCPRCGLPTEKGKPVCQACGYPLEQTKKKPVAAASRSVL